MEPYFYSWSKEDINTACRAMIPPGKSFKTGTASEVLSRSVATSLEGKMLTYTYTCGDLQHTPTVTSEAQSSDDGDLESDHSIDSEPAGQQGGEPSTSEDEGRRVTSELAAQYAQGHGEASTTNRDENESAAQQVTEYSIAMNCLKSLESAEFEVFNDPVHGSIELHPLLVSIVNTPAFNRLKNIKQLGGVHYVYHGATHTRFEHSIGTCHIAGEFVRRLQRKQPELGITDREILLVEIAALCHDLGHGPLSYVFINEVKSNIHPKLFRKEELSSLIFEHHIYNHLKTKFLTYGINGSEVPFIQELIDHDLVDRVMMQPDRQFLYEIVANKESGIDVDKWDYFARDCHYLGIPNEFNWRRLMTLSRVIKVDGVYRICYRDKEVNNLYGMFRTRTSLFQRAYKHPTVISIEHMIGNAIVEAKEEKLLQDESTNELVSIADALTGMTKDTPCLEGFLALTDSIVSLILNSPSTSDKMIKAKNILRKLDRREMLHLAAKDNSSQQFPEETLKSELSSSTSEEVYIKQVKLCFGSEKVRPMQNVSWNQDDPVNRVYFYKKETPWKAVRGGELFGHDDQQTFSPNPRPSDLVIPWKFEEKTTLVYSPERKRKSTQSAYGEIKRRKLNTST